jgi:cytochrome c peroxidase
MIRPQILLPFALAALLVAVIACSPGGQKGWTEKEATLIASLSLSTLPPLPPDPSNRVADDARAVALGEALFSDTAFSGNGAVACASCHLPDQQFQDNLPLGKGMGQTGRRTMPIAGTAYAPFLFWDGRKDSQWSQALGPLESAVEHGGDRTQYAHIIAAAYRTEYEALFGPLPDLSVFPPHAAPTGAPEVVAAWAELDDAQRDTINRIFSNMGKAIAAFERTIMPSSTRFDRYADAIAAKDPGAADMLTAEEQLGLSIFIGKGNCINCHNGPLLTDNHFHNTGAPSAAATIDTGRAQGAVDVLADPFNCLGAYSDAGDGDCAELRYMVAEGEELEGAFKPPSLRGVTQRPPFMNAGQFTTLDMVLDHYNRAPASPVGHNELVPLGLTEPEIAALAAFLKTLDAPA